MLSNDLTRIPPAEPTRPAQDARPAVSARPIPTDPGRLSLLLARMDRLPALLTPLLWAGGLVWWLAGRVDGLLLGLSFLAHGGALLFLHLWITYQDYRRAQGRAVPPGGINGSGLDGLTILRRRVVRPGTVRSMAFISASVSVMATLWLGLLVGWPLWFFGWLELFLFAIYAGPPMALGYRGWGLGELILFLGLGWLPMIAAFYAQTQHLDAVSLADMLPLALLALLTGLGPAFVTWRRDWKLRKQTLVVLLGPERALILAIVIAVLAFTSLVVLVALGYLPIWSLLGLFGMPPLIRACAQAYAQPYSRQAGRLVEEATSYAALLTTGLLLLSLWLAR